jgi:hypothetical protein
MSSSSYSYRFSRNIGIAAVSQYTITEGITYPYSGGTSSYSTSFGVSNASFQLSTTHLSAFTGLKLAVSDFSGTLPLGEYWFAFNHSTTVTTQQTAAISAARLLFSHAGISATNASIASAFGASARARDHQFPFVGTFTVAGGTDISRVDQSIVLWAASGFIPHVQLGRLV